MSDGLGVRVLQPFANACHGRCGFLQLLVFCHEKPRLSWLSRRLAHCWALTMEEMWEKAAFVP
eukprot:8840313-Lingulodinium_polyedra.AAC.1